MEQLICFFGVAVLITLFHLLKVFLMEEKFDFFEILGYYLKATVIINVVLILAIYCGEKYWMWNKELSGDFVIAYIIIGSFIGLFLPAFYYNVRKLRKK